MAGKWHQKNILKQTVPGVDPGAVKRKYLKFWFSSVFTALLLLLILFLVNNHYPNFVKANLGLIVICSFFLLAIYLFVQAYFCFKYKMIGGLGCFPTASGKAALYVGAIYLVLAFICIIFALIFLANLSR